MMVAERGVKRYCGSKLVLYSTLLLAGQRAYFCPSKTDADSAIKKLHLKDSRAEPLPCTHFNRETQHVAFAVVPLCAFLKRKLKQNVSATCSMR